MELDPEYVTVWFNKGVVLSNLDQNNEALELNPDYVDAWYNKGFYLSRRGKYPEALEPANIAINLDPEISEA